MLNRRRRKLTIDQFFEEFADRDERFEMIDGEAWMMAGGTKAHNLTVGNIFRAVANRLAGSTCRPFGSDMGLMMDAENIRFPDVAVYCDPRDLSPDTDADPFLRYPVVVFEVLSPGTRVFDRGGKVAEYKRLASIETIVLVDHATRTCEVHERDGRGWTEREVPADSSLEIRRPSLTLEAAEIFVR